MLLGSLSGVTGVMGQDTGVRETGDWALWNVVITGAIGVCYQMATRMLLLNDY